MKLPNGYGAVVDIEKLHGYCLDVEHPRGKHKARVFRAVLGLTPEDAWSLREALLDAAAHGIALQQETDNFGVRYVVDFKMNGTGGSALVRSAWKILHSEDCPRLTSCYVL